MSREGCVYAYIYMFNLLSHRVGLPTISLQELLQYIQQVRNQEPERQRSLNSPSIMTIPVQNTEEGYITTLVHGIRLLLGSRGEVTSYTVHRRVIFLPPGGRAGYGGRTEREEVHLSVYVVYN